MKHKKRTRYTSEDLKVWCEAEVTEDQIAKQWSKCTCIACLEKAIYGSNKKGYWIDEISRLKAREQYDLLRRER